MKQRWFTYLMIGIGFGVFDFYYHSFLSNTLRLQQVSSPGMKIAWLLLSIGIWLVPIVPIAFHEVKKSLSLLGSVLASSLTWSSAIIAYYLTNAAQLAFIGVSTRPEMHISNLNNPFFWSNWKSVFFYDILGGMVEWIFVALVGGSILGLLISIIYLRFVKSGKHNLSL